MKKITLWLFALFTCWQMTAQTGTVVVGSNDGTPNSSTGDPSPLQDYYKTQRIQILYTASELTSAGLVAGNITEIGWVATALNDCTLQENYSISLKSTTSAVLTSTFETGATLVYGPTDFTPSAIGNVMFTLTTPFSWDGTSNIIVEVCAGSASGTYTENVSCANSTTTAIQTVYYRNDSATSPCTQATGTTTTDRPLLVAKGNVATCLAPLNVVAANITAFTADLSWDATSSTSGIGYEYVISTTNATPTAAGIATTNIFASISSLLPQTTYYVFIRTNCGAGQFSGWSGPTVITTACASVASFNQNFDAVTLPGFPVCWEKIGNGGSAYIDSFNASSTPNVLYMSSWSTTDLAVIKMQPVSNLGAGTHRIKFNIRGSWATGGIVEFGYLTDPLDASTFVALTSITATSLTYESVSYAPPAGTYSSYPALRHPGNPTDSVLIDDVVWELVPTCPDQTGLVVSGITSTGANTSWDDLSTSGALGYQYAITTSATPPASGTDSTALFYVATGLTPQTGYYLHVRPACAAGSFGNWASISFTTACSPVTTYPSIEPFATFLPSQCWLKGDNGDITAGPATFGSNSFYQDGFANVGFTGSFAYNIWQDTANDWIISPQFAIPATGYELKFDVAAANYGATTAVTNWESDDSVEVLVSTTDTTNWTVLHTFNNSNVPSNTGEVKIIDLDTYSGQTVRFAYRVVEGSTNGAADIEFFIDNFQVRLTPSCIEPLGVVFASVTSTGAAISWDPTTPEPTSGYEYFVSTSNTLPTTAGTAVTTTFAVLTGLMPATTYYVFVRANCGSSSFSPWTTPITFTTACASITSFVQNFDSVTLPGFPVCWEKVGTAGSAYIDSFNASSTPNVLYMASWSTADMAVVKMQPVSNLGAGTHRLKLKIRGSWATGGIVEFGYLTNPLDATTFVALTTITAASLTYDNITFNPPVGTYSDYPAFRHTGAPTEGLLIDDVIWEAIPSCVEPTALVYTNITSSGVGISWTAPATAPANGYQYVVSTSATLPTTAGTAVTNSFVSVSGLTPSTTYYIFVKAICSSSDESAWVGPVSFLTSCLPVTTLPWTEGFEGLTAVGNSNFPPCWSKENGDWVSRNTNDTYSTSNTGTNFIRNSWNATNEIMWTPGFQLTAGTSYDFSSYIQGDNGDSWAVDYLVNSNQFSSGATQLGATYTIPGAGSSYAAQPYSKITRSFTPTTTGVYYFAIRLNEPTGGPWYASFDDFELKVTPNVIPACATGLQSTPNTTCGNFASQLSWAPVTDATGYYVTVGTTSGGTDIANAVSVSTTNYSFSGTINTQYFWKVVPFSGAGPATGCAEQTFTTVATGCYCASVPTTNDGTGITNATVGATPFVIADVMYANNTATAIAVEPGTDTNVQLTFGTGYTYDINIWIDFNNDFDFDDAGELVKTGIACTATVPNTVDASFLMPATAPTGAHRMRIGTADLGQATPAPCYSGSYGVTLDFTVDTTLGTNSFDTSNFVAYPNPVKDVLNLSYKTAISNVKVINLLGQEVVNANANTNDVQVNMSALNAGVYMVNVTVDNTVHAIKVIKE